MKTRELSIAMVVLAALLGVLYWSNHRRAKAEVSVSTSSDTAPKILSLNQGDITGLRIVRANQPEVALTQNGAAGWQITAPGPMAADQESVSSVLSTLSSLNSERLLEEKAGDLQSYGLAQPDLQIELTVKGNKTQKLLVGDQTPAGNSYYAMLAGDPRLFTLAGYNKTSLDKSVNDLRDKRLLTADFDKVSQIELVNQKSDKKSDVTFARDKDAWQILKPKPYRADETQVDDLIRALREARFEATADDESAKLASQFKSATPLAQVQVTGASGTQDLEVRKSKDEYVAKSSMLPGVYKVPGTLGTSLDKSLSDFQNKKILNFGYQNPNKVEIHDGSKSYFLTRTASDWWGPDGKKLDESSVESVLGSLRDLTADKFPDTGFTTPAVEITVTSQEGGRIEKVSLSKSGDAYIAKRENEAELYSVPAAQVSELQKTASELKPAAPAMPAPAKK